MKYSRTPVLLHFEPSGQLFPSSAVIDASVENAALEAFLSRKKREYLVFHSSKIVSPQVGKPLLMKPIIIYLKGENL